MSCIQYSIEKKKWPFLRVENTKAYSQCLQMENWMLSCVRTRFKEKRKLKRIYCFFKRECQNDLCTSLFKNYFNFSVLFSVIFDWKWNWFKPNAEAEEYWVTMLHLHVRFYVALCTSKGNEHLVLDVDLPGFQNTCTWKPCLEPEQHRSCNRNLMKFNLVWLFWLWTLL